MLQVNTEPVHQQLLRECRMNIARGVYEPGNRFPSERELAHEFGVSRATANKVIAGLIAEELLEHRKGIGTFVARPKGLYASLHALDDFATAADELGFKAETRVLDFTRLKAAQAPVAVRKAMELELKENLVYIERLHSAAGEPLIYERRWIRAALVPGLKKNDVAASFYGALERFEIHVATERQSVTASIPNRAEASKLNLKGAAALRIEAVQLDEEQLAMGYSIALYRADRFSFENDVRPQRAATISALTLK